VENILSQPYVSPTWSRDKGMSVGKIFAKTVSMFHRECDVPECHMLSFIWGTGWPALYEHHNLDPVTHYRGGDLYGATGLNYYRHINKMVRKNRALKYNPTDTRYAALPDDYLEYAAEIETPVLFMTGENNRVFADSNILAHKTLETVVPGRHELHIFPNYGHQDVFMGKNVAEDIFPRLLKFLQKHSN
jgi:cholesterol oxidase